MEYPSDLIPPEDLWIAFGGGDFRAMGEKLLRQFIEYAGLTPHDRVLDVGCGAGRAAVPLTAYLSGRGSYRGFDAYPFGVDWCREHITPRHPRFVFERADVFNTLYNPYGKTPASEFRFPYPDASFECIIATSVFTHMLPADMARYFEEMARVLAPGGRACITYFLLNDESRALLREGRGKPALTHRYGSFYVEDPAAMEDAVGYSESFVRAMYASRGIEIARLIPGSWCGRAGMDNGQDIVVGVKP
ncbi:MAG: class I SAM-dependent methyltransferase [Desulfovibrionaceae bacterium]|nr:class I SAM-dependent methyltransferase [Desulfovibrionaceae bacterium]MBF0513905.1 class I SAM-dependent methyltransferase [Desulfovibrionaceae bacterium]